MIDPYLTDVDVYGASLVANDQLVVSIIDRNYPSIGIYRPYSSYDFCRIDMDFLAPQMTYIMLVAISRNGSVAPNQFFFQGVPFSNNVEQGAIWGVVNFSLKPCGWLSFNLIHLWNPTDYTLLGVSAPGNVYLYTDTGLTYFGDTNSETNSSVNATSWPDGSDFVPYAIEISADGWGVIAGTVPNSDSIYLPILYLISFPPNVTIGNTNYVVLARWTASFAYPWQSQKARTVSGSNNFNAFYALSLSINNQGDILFGVQSMNTVFHLYVNVTISTSFFFKGSRIYSTTIPSIGFGKSVGWLDDTTAVILANNISLDYTIWDSSQIEIYDLSNGQELTDTQQPYSSFPTARQPMYSALTGRILLMKASYARSIIFMDSNGLVYIILPSQSGYYTATNVGNMLGIGTYFSSSTLCPDGSWTNGLAGGKYLFDTCKPCPEGTFRSSSINITAGCIPCNVTESFCPLAAVAEVPSSYLNQISQATAFPRSPDLTRFEDILLLNMFNTNFKLSCLATTPFFWTLTMLGIAAVIIITMASLQLTGKCENFRATMESAFRHFDVISDGEVSYFICLNSSFSN
jgi:hypothetical protein